MFISSQALLIRLFLGHIVADFLLQSRFMADEKGKKTWKSGALYIHSGIYAAVVFIATSSWNQFLWLLPALFISHTLIDGWKASRGNKTLTFIADQVGHLTILALVYFFLAQSAKDEAGALLLRLWNSPRHLYIVLGYLIVIWPVGRLMNLLTMPFRRQLEDEKSRGLELAGFWIGCLERVFLLSFILLAYLPGAALLLGLKSLFRFGEIRDPKNRKETEYILIGTMLSYGFAIAVGVIIKALIKTPA